MFFFLQAKVGISHHLPTARRQPHVLVVQQPSEPILTLRLQPRGQQDTRCFGIQTGRATHDSAVFTLNYGKIALLYSSFITFIHCLNEVGSVGDLRSDGRIVLIFVQCSYWAGLHYLGREQPCMVRVMCASALWTMSGSCMISVAITSSRCVCLT